MKYITLGIILTVGAFLLTAKTEAAAQMNMPFIQSPLAAPNFNNAQTFAPVSTSAPMMFNQTAASVSQNQMQSSMPQQSGRFMPQTAPQPQPTPIQPVSPIRPMPIQQPGQQFILVPINQNQLPQPGSGSCPDFLGDIFACVRSPIGQQPILTPITPITGGPCPDFLGDIFACVPSPRFNSFPIFSTFPGSFPGQVIFVR